jgi:hypothetical protein
MANTSPTWSGLVSLSETSIQKEAAALAQIADPLSTVAVDSIADLRHWFASLRWPEDGLPGRASVDV